MALDLNTPALSRPSLYSTIKLAHLVQGIKDRLKSLIQKQAGPKGPAYSKERRSSIQAAGVAIRDAHPGCALYNSLPRQCGQKQLRTSELECKDLLRSLDSHTPLGHLSLCRNAAQDSLFLQHNFRHLKNAKTLPPLHRVLDLTTALLRRMKCLRRGLTEDGPDDYVSFGLTFDDIISDTFYANLEHLLQCLHQIALDAVVCYCLSMLVGDLFRWNHHQRDREEWFAEWPNAQHPLNTTWPWNGVKTALLVLWGVCWMFYGNGGASSSNNQATQGRNPYGQNFRTRLTPQPLPGTSQPNTTDALTSPSGTFANYSWLHPAHPRTTPRRANESHPGHTQPTTQPAYPTSLSTYPYITPSPYVSSDLFPASTVAWPYAQGSNTSSVPDNPHFSSLWQPTSSDLGTLTDSPQGIENNLTFPYANTRSRRQPHQQQQQQQLPTPTTQSTGSTFGGLGFDLGLSLQTNMQNYPSPQYSDVSGPTFAACMSTVPGTVMQSPGLPVVLSPSIAGTSVSRQSSNKSSEPTRDANGRLYCDHQEHGSSPPFFTRKCEWSKHMDKHTRPYTCEEPGCENIRGFTYSGGLHRHQREVHRQYGGPKAKCMCPHQDCKRSTGLGFSRRENLMEHLRRVHRDVPAESRTGQAGEQSLPKLGDSRKRRRKVDEADDLVDEDDKQTPQDLKQEVKRLRKEVQDKDDRLERLEQQMDLLTKMAQRK